MTSNRLLQIVVCLPLACGLVWSAEPTPLNLLTRVLGQTDDADVQLDVLKGMQAGLFGRREVPMPADWSNVARKLRQSPRKEVRELALTLSLVFGDPEAIALLRKTLADGSAEMAARQTAMQALLQRKEPDLAPVLQGLLGDKTLRGPAIRGLATYRDDNTPKVILKEYASLTEKEKADAVQTLAARIEYARVLVAALEAGQVKHGDISAFIVRQLHGMGDKSISEKLNKSWGTIRAPSQEKAALMTKYKAILTPDALKKANKSEGRVVFAKTCAVCHTLFDDGGKIGPELTGSQRANLDYVLENVLDPSAVVPKDYQVTIIQTKDGRVLNGIIKREDDRALILQTPNEQVTVPKNEIEERNLSPLSLMPEGQLEKMTTEEIRNLVAYLASPGQVPLPKQEPKK